MSTFHTSQSLTIRKKGLSLSLEKRNKHKAETDQ